ncbi:hypothetical protein RvY_17083 [Ramazzottius varieornatus]|uniref:Phospholipase A-2-activating protein n=1 Tax=Ramazzottius varieornatus TaxID=947166 RepID=A0A1D1W6Z9_RAMVA|nr:hypothetical protein RvY_17083 [Ramazzottius varieornatus]
MSGAEESYKLHAVLTGHAGDVRALAATRSSPQTFISGSRDKTCLVWTENEGRFSSTACFKGHQKYVSSVAWLPTNTSYPQGLFLTGSHDKLVEAHNPLSPNPAIPEFTLAGHKDAVSAVAAHESGMILTGSWDCTAILWQDSMRIATLEGHAMAVWAVEFVFSSTADGDVLLATGSADKTVKIWNISGKLIKTLSGHSDVVRGLVSLRSNEVLSCANDATIRHWDIQSGTCRQVHYGHSNYIYSIARLGLDGFVTSSEDASVRVWKEQLADSLQTIRLPARSIWAVAALPNGDIVTGSSDGIIRVFTRDSSRAAGEEIQKAYEAELATMAVDSKEVLEGIKMEDLPTEAALLQPGRKDGQTKIIRRGKDKVEIHNWSASQGCWTKIGDVVGSTGGSQQSSGKTLHQGKEYDYVFNVDFDENKPPVKLPYNLSEDPWMVAQTFLHTQDLPQSYLETVAKFIMQNAPGAGSIPQSATTPSAVYSDPFTGGGRYVAGGFGGGGPATKSALNSDPFTGATSYHTGGAAATVANTSTAPASNDNYPLTEFVGFHTANVEGILKKLLEFTKSQGIELSESTVKELSGLMQKETVSASAPSFEAMNDLGRLLDLPEGKLFPALDLLRLAIRHQAVCDYFCGVERGAFFLDFLLPLVKTNKSAANQQLSLKILSNTFLAGASGHHFLSQQRQKILSAVAESTNSPADKNAQIARITLIVNFAVMLNGRGATEDKLQLLYGLVEMMKVPTAVSDDEALFRAFVALGTLMVGGGDELRGYAAALDVRVVGAALTAGSHDEKVKGIWRALERDLAG